MKFKINFPSGYNDRDILDDNIDIILENGKVFFATLFTLIDVQKRIVEEMYFWSTDMIIVSDLKMNTIRSTVKRILNDGYLKSATTYIGELGAVFGEDITFESLSIDVLES